MCVSLPHLFPLAPPKKGNDHIWIITVLRNSLLPQLQISLVHVVLVYVLFKPTDLLVLIPQPPGSLVQVWSRFGPSLPRFKPTEPLALLPQPEGGLGVRGMWRRFLWTAAAEVSPAQLLQTFLKSTVQRGLSTLFRREKEHA